MPGVSQEMARQRLDNWCERGILGLVLAILVFTPLAFGGYPQRPTGSALNFLAVNPFGVVQVITLAVLLLWALRFWLGRRPQLLWPPICWAVVAFVGYAIARYLTADIEYAARQELIQILVYAFLFFAILNNLHRQESTQIIALTLVFLAMVISFYAIYQFLTNSDQVWHLVKPYKHRGSGTYISPNHLAGFLEMLLPLGLAYTLVGRLKPLFRVLVGYASLVIVIGIGVTVSRGSWIASGLALVVFFGLLAMHRNYRLPALVLMAFVVCGAAFFIVRTDFFQQRFRHLHASSLAEVDVRYELWGATTRMWQDNFWWGVGPGLFDYRFRIYRPDSVQLRPDRAHNEYLNTLADWGLAGALIVGAALVLLSWGMVRTWEYVRSPENVFKVKLSNRFAFVLGASVGLLALLLHSTVDFNMHIPANAILAIGLMALLSSHLRFATERYWVSARTGRKWLATLVLLAGGGYLGCQTWRHANECGWLGRAAKAPLFSPAQIAAYEKAFAIEPRNFETTYSLGEAYRVQSWQGNDDYVALARKAMQWYERGMNLNPHHSHNFLRYGMCLDWMGRQNESGPYFERADQLDPNGYFTAANIGWHYVQVANYAAARPWFERSRRLEWKDNQIAVSYLELAERKMREAAASR